MFVSPLPEAPDAPNAKLPIAIFLSVSTFASKAALPIAIFLSPLVLAVNAALPIAIFSPLPLAVTLSKAVSPKATLLVPVG